MTNYASCVDMGQHITSQHIVWDFRRDIDLIGQWGQVCRREFRWSPRWGEVSVVLSAKHPTPEAANAEAAKMALDNGYTPPKWWQWWRHGEASLPA